MEMDDSTIENATIAIQNPGCRDSEVESDISYSQESVSPNGVRMLELGSAGEFLTRVELDLAYSTEKLVNLDVLLMHVAARESDFEAIITESDEVFAGSVEKAMEFNLLSGVLDSEVKEMDNFMEYLEREIVDTRQKISSCEHLRDAFSDMEEKLHDSEEYLKQLKDQVSELRMQSAKFQRTLLAYSGQENSNDGKSADFFESNQFSSRNAKFKMQTAEQQRHILRMLEKSLARELDLEKKLSESRKNEEELKLKLHSMEHEVFCMEEAEEFVCERLLEAANTAEVLMGISKEMLGRLHVVQFNLNGSIQRENETNSKYKDSMEQLSAKESAFQKLESSSTELDNFLLDQTTSLKASLKEAEDNYILANSEASGLREKVNSLEEQLKGYEVKLQNAKASLEASQEENSALSSEISEMKNVFKDLKKNISEAECKAESAEAKCVLLTETDLELKQELGLLKSTGSNMEKINFLEKQLRDADIQLQHAKASAEASQEQQILLYSTIEDMENLTGDMKSKVSKSKSRAESAETKCILLCETNMELSEELNFLRGRIESLESSLDKADNAKVATAKDISIRTKVITDLVMQLTRERERVQKQCWEMAPRAIDVGWMYCTKINNNRLQTKCNFCDACHYGGGVTRHKQHLAGGYANVQKCTKCPLEISRKMQEHLASSRAKGNQREDDDERLTEELMEDIDEYRGSDVGPDDEDAEMVAAMRASKEEARAHEWEMRHGMRRSQSYRPGEGSGSATPSSRRKEKSERVEAFCRSASVKEMFEMFKDSGKGKMKSTDKGKKKKSPDIRDMADPAAYRPRDASQRRIEESLKSHSLRARMGRAISRWFHSALIPAHKAKDPHFKAMVREIQRCGPNVTPPTPYEISGTYLDEVVVEVKEYIERFKEKWPEYGVTIMCDGWSGPTRLSIINFLVFCDGRTIFHKSINASAEIKDAAYLYRLMDEVVEEIGEENVVQIVTDNAANFKKAGLSLMQKRQHIYWTPCAAHCIDLIFKDIGEIKKIQDLVSDARRITNFIYNHSWVLALMRSHTLGDLVRPASTRFATNYVALSSLLERMDGLVQMFTSQDWFCSTYASSEPGRYVQDLVTSTRFWAKIRRVNGLMQPLFSILREVDGDKDQTMGILMDRMLRAMLTVVQLNTSESQKVAKIIDSRLGGMLLQDIHRAASYLNPTLQYQDARLGYDVEILDALRRVINRMEPDTIRAAAAVDEISSLINENKNLAKLLRTKDVSVAMSNQGNETNKEPPVSNDVLITTSSTEVSKEAIVESSATGFQVNELLKEEPFNVTHVKPTIFANNAISEESKSETVRAIGAGELINSKHLLGAVLACLVSLAAVYLFRREILWLNNS